MWQKNRYASGTLAISEKLILKLMLAIMSEDPNLTPHEINLRQTL
jgi:3-hydroxyacyl-CoA dehydrogenase/enoyl-CoA hydratase/3-hydroxybutyryl-CoA epimerase